VNTEPVPLRLAASRTSISLPGMFAAMVDVHA
jgi:hypothetical protein